MIPGPWVFYNFNPLMDAEPVCSSCKCPGVLDEFGECEDCVRDWNIRFENQGLE